MPVKFSRPTFPPTNRSGGQVDGKEKHRITRLILPLLVLFATIASSISFSFSHFLVPLLSPAIVIVTGFLPSRSALVAAVLECSSCSCALCACSRFLPSRVRCVRWQHPYRYPFSHSLQRRNVEYHIGRAYLSVEK